MGERLSSYFTFFYKFVFSALWSGGFGVGTATMVITDSPEIWRFAFAWVVGSIFIWWGCARLKRVEMADGMLRISNYFREAVVSIGEVETVTQNRFINLRLITVNFRKDTCFGRSIFFMPPFSFRIFSEDEVVTRLRRLAMDVREARMGSNV